jgi:hypothetical protein
MVLEPIWSQTGVKPESNRSPVPGPGARLEPNRSQYRVRFMAMDLSPSGAKPESNRSQTGV